MYNKGNCTKSINPTPTHHHVIRVRSLILVKLVNSLNKNDTIIIKNESQQERKMSKDRRLKPLQNLYFIRKKRIKKRMDNYQ